MFPEYFSKIAACPQTAVMGNLCNRSLCFYQFHTCFSKSVFSHIFQWTHMKFFLKQSKTGSLTDMCFLCKLLDQYRLRVMLLNIAHHCFHFFIGIFVFMYFFCFRTCNIQKAKPYFCKQLSKSDLISSTAFVQIKTGTYFLQKCCLSGIFGRKTDHFKPGSIYLSNSTQEQI